MIVEQALEKHREAQAAKARHEDIGHHHALPPAAATRRDRPAFPVLHVEQSTAEMHRILLLGPSGPGEAFADAAYRMLRARVLQKLRKNGWTRLAITSPGPGDGKSVSSLNLALNIARDKANDVFLIDLDFRNPSICRFLDIVPRVELASYFGGEGGPEQTLFSIGPRNLAIAGSVQPSAQSSELLANQKLEELLAFIASISDKPTILIDLPPLLATDEALLVAPRVDATALIVSEGHTRRDSVIRAKKMLADYTFAGVILNRSSETFGARNYYNYAYSQTDKPRS